MALAREQQKDQHRAVAEQVVAARQQEAAQLASRLNVRLQEAVQRR